MKKEKLSKKTERVTCNEKESKYRSKKAGQTTRKYDMNSYIKKEWGGGRRKERKKQGMKEGKVGGGGGGGGRKKFMGWST